MKIFTEDACGETLQADQVALHAKELNRHVLNGSTMGTRYSATFYSEDKAVHPQLPQALFEAVDVVDRQMSTWNATSDLMRLNAAPLDVWIEIPKALCTVLAMALEINKDSGGVFDPAVGDMVQAWGFGFQSNQPDAVAIRSQLGQKRPETHELIDLDVEALKVRKRAKIQLDLCGIAKGYGVDQMAECLTSFGIENALVGIDGEMRAMGCKPDGHPWSIAVEQPDHNLRQAMGLVELEDASVATSGDYRHWVEVGNRKFSHTMDPRLGGPLQNNLASVVVIAETCMQADAWATVLMVLGDVAGPYIARSKDLNALFIVRDGPKLTQVPVGPAFL